MKKLPAGESGFTLVELVIAVALMGFVILLAYLLYFFGTRSFDLGTAQAHVQQSARLADEVLRNELRNADFLTLVAGGGEPESFTGSFRLINGCFNQNSRPITDDVIADVEVWIREESACAVLAFRIKSVDGAQEYSITNEVLLNNISLQDLTSFALNQVYSLNDYALYYGK
ncbi:MAG: prepilin-type N-terminal cleavage/methylation domain-containing protein [Bacillota bacterium]